MKVEAIKTRFRRGEETQEFGLVCDDCREDMEVSWCESPKHPTFNGGHLVRPFTSGPKIKRRGRAKDHEA